MEAEETIWEGRYSSRNFLGRAVCGALFAFAWVMLAIVTWGFGYANFNWLAYAIGVAVAVYWLSFGFKFFRVRRNHYYRLTTRRLFLTTGILQAPCRPGRIGPNQRSLPPSEPAWLMAERGDAHLDLV